MGIIQQIQNLMGIAVLKPLNWGQLVLRNTKNIQTIIDTCKADLVEDICY